MKALWLALSGAAPTLAPFVALASPRPGSMNERSSERTTAQDRIGVSVQLAVTVVY